MTTNPIIKNEIIRLFHDYGHTFMQMTPKMFQISTKQIIFTYNGENKSVKDVSLLAFTDNGKVWFNDEGFEINKIDEAPFMLSTKPTNYVHPLVPAHVKALIIEQTARRM